MSSLSLARAHTHAHTRQGDYAGLLRLYAEWEDAGGVRKGLAWCKQARAQTHTHTTMHAQARKHARKHASARTNGPERAHTRTHTNTHAHIHDIRTAHKSSQQTKTQKPHTHTGGPRAERHIPVSGAESAGAAGA